MHNLFQPRAFAGILTGMAPTRISSPSVVTGFSFAAMFFLGLGVAIVGAAARNAGIAAEEVGFLLTAQHLGFFLSVAVAGALADRVPKPVVLAVGSVVLAAGFGGFYLWSPFAVNVAFMVLVGIGIGTYEGTTDAFLIDLHPHRKSLFINVNHFFVTMGSLVITVYLIFLQMAWRASMTQAAAVVAVLAVLFAVSRPRATGSPHGHGGAGAATTAPAASAGSTAPAASAASASTGVSGLLRSPVMWALLVGTICSVGIELGSIGLLTTYLMELRGFTQVTSKVGLLLFIGGFGIGRLALGSLIRDESAERWVTGYFGASVVTTLLLYALEPTWLLYGFSLLAGLSVSVLLPSIIAIGGTRFPDQAGTAIGIVKMGIPVGGMLLPLLVSLFTRAASLQTALLAFPAAAVLGAAAMLVISRHAHPGMGSSAQLVE